MLKLLVSQKRIVFWLTLLMLLAFAFTPRGYALAQSGDQPPPQPEAQPTTFPYKKKFVISGYYSPLPGQERYATGSFEGDVRLNGEGVHTADGTVVYPGLAAAPKTFAFGTKMDIPGFGIVAVHDRGGAIKGNRLDIWLGSGDEGLRRALGWGMRTVEVTVFGVDPNIKELVNFDNVQLANNVGFLARTQYFTKDLGESDEGEKVRVLQTYLKQFGYLSSEPTGFYGHGTEAAVKAFQLAEKVIDNGNDYGAGNFGPRTRIAFEDVMRDKAPEALGVLITQANTASASSLSSSAVSVPPKPAFTLVFTKDLDLNDSGNEVTLLQDELRRLNFFGLPSTGFYGKTTEHAVFKFQQAVGLVATEKDSGAGVVGPRTRQLLHEKIIARSETQKSIAQAEENHEIVQSRIENEKQLIAGLVESYNFAADIVYGTRSTDVQQLQATLKQLGFFPGRFTTEYFGDITKASLVAFQQNHGLDASGYLDERTRLLLNRLMTQAS